jgi:hypothetical protein
MSKGGGESGDDCCANEQEGCGEKEGIAGFVPRDGFFEGEGFSALCEFVQDGGNPGARGGVMEIIGEEDGVDEFVGKGEVGGGVLLDEAGDFGVGGAVENGAMKQSGIGEKREDGEESEDGEVDAGREAKSSRRGKGLR